MLSNKPDIVLRPIFVMFKQDKTILSGSVRRESLNALKLNDIALRTVFKAYESTGRVNEPMAKIVREGINAIADLEFFNTAVYDEIQALKDYSDRLKEQNEQLRDRNYELKIENQQLKF